MQNTSHNQTLLSQFMKLLLTPKYFNQKYLSILENVTTFILAVVALYMFFYFLIFWLTVNPSGDDNGVAEGTFGWENLVHYYFNWSGRVLLVTPWIFFCHYLTIFRIFVFIGYLSLPIAFYILLNFDDLKNVKNPVNKIVACIGITALLPHYMMTDTGIVSTTAYYFIPLLAMLWMYVLLLIKKFSIATAAIVFILSLIAFNFEQNCLLGLLTLIPLYYSRKVDNKLFVILVVGGLLSLANHLTCPGNTARFYHEVECCNVEYATYSLFDKLYLGAILFFGRVMHVTQPISLFLMIAVFISALSLNKNHKIYIFKVLLVVATFIFYYKSIQNIPFYWLSSKNEILSTVSFKFIKYAITFTILMLLSFFAVNLDRKNLLIFIWIFLSACAVAFSICFSSTIFLSGVRTTYLSCIIFTLLAMYLLYRSENKVILSLSNIVLSYLLIFNSEHIIIFDLLAVPD